MKKNENAVKRVKAKLEELFEEVIESKKNTFYDFVTIDNNNARSCYIRVATCTKSEFPLDAGSVKKIANNVHDNSYIICVDTKNNDDYVMPTTKMISYIINETGSFKNFDAKKYGQEYKNNYSIIK